jgi:hypothetical protein
MSNLLEDLTNICDQLKIDINLVTNMYIYGSQSHGSASETSDWDCILVGRFEQGPLVFKNKINEYYHDNELYELTINGRKYDIQFYSNKNFEKLMKLNYMIVVDLLFNEDKFHPLNKINYKQIYLEKYYDVKEIIKSVGIELNYSFYSLSLYRKDKLQFDHCDATWVTKKLFNAVHYHDIAIQLIKDKTIYDFSRMSHVKHTINQMQKDKMDPEEIFIYVKKFLSEKIREFKVVNDQIKKLNNN